MFETPHFALKLSVSGFKATVRGLFEINHISSFRLDMIILTGKI